MNFNRFAFSAMVLLSLTIFISCDKEEEETNSSFNLNITGLEDLGADAAYEGWLIVDGNPVTTGTFTVDANGTPSSSSFEVATADLDAASTFVLTIEPSPDNDPDPSSTHILAGDFSNGTADLSIEHPAALNNSFDTSNGVYILATPTNGEENDENSGIWFLDLTTGMPTVGLDLPTLPDGWAYEGWAVIDGTPVSTGTFTDLSATDAAAPFSGTEASPSFPGEDFLNNAPAGLSFPTDIAGGTAVISIEPVPDNSAAPFTLKPLVGAIPTNAVDHFTYNLDRNLTFPTGQVTR